MFGVFLVVGKIKPLDDASSTLGVLVIKDGAGGGLAIDVVPSISTLAELVGLSAPEGPYFES